MTNRKFYKTVITVEVLSEEPIPEGMELDSIVHEAREGSFSMRQLWENRTVLNGGQVVEALLEQGSSPDFFSLTSDGEDV